MKIDTSKIEGYENLTTEEKLKVLEGFEYTDYSDEVNRYKNAVSKANSEVAEYKRKHRELEEEKLKQLSEEERAKVEAENRLKELASEVENLRKEKTISTYETQFLGQGYTPELAKETAKALVSGDMSTFFANQLTFKNNLIEETNKARLKNQPSLTPGVPVINEDRITENTIRANMGLPPV